MFHPVIEKDLEYIISKSISWEKLRGKSVLITGVNGMIASYILYTLLYLNDTKHMDIQVWGLTRSREKTEKRFGSLLERKDFLILEQDVTQPITADVKIDYMIHAASQTGPKQFMEDPVGTIASNNIGTYLLLEFAKKHSIEKFLFLSTREIYGKNDLGKEYVTEDDYGSMDPTLLRASYPESKRVSETMCRAYKEQYGIDCKVARIAHTYGPGIVVGDGRVVGDFLKNVLHHEDISMNSDGSAILALTYIADTVSGLFMTMLDFGDFVYNISSEKEIVSVKELAYLLCEVFKDRNLKTVIRDCDDNGKAGYLKHKVALLSSDKAHRAGWIPEISLREGFLRTVQYIESK